MAQLCYVSVLSLVVWWFLLRPNPCHCQNITQPEFAEDDIRCLSRTKDGLKDQYEALFTWRFGNSTPGFICSFVGVQCWHNDDGKVLSLKLPGMGLEGGFPEGLKYCTRMTTLDLSSNGLSGSIPKDLCKWLPFLVSLALSGNQLTGSIPHELYHCTYLTVLRLNDNQLSGSIPWEMALLERLKDFNFTNNMLSGQIPAKWAKNYTDLFGNNSGLCGDPLPKSCSQSKWVFSRAYAGNMGIFIGGFAAGMLGVCFFGFALWWLFKSLSRKKLDKRIKYTQIAEVTENETFSL